MTRLQGRKDVNSRRRPRGAVQRAWLALTLLCLGGVALASNDPPPPGPYQSEPLQRPTVPSSAAREETPADAAPTGTSSRMLPLPGGTASAPDTPYSATNLFGSAPAPAPVEAPGQAVPRPAAQAAPGTGPQAAPEAPRRAAAAPPGYGAGAYFPQVPTGYPTYPSYGPAFPGYRPYPGQAAGRPSGIDGRPLSADPPWGHATGYPPGGFRDAAAPAAPPPDAHQIPDAGLAQPPMVDHPGPGSSWDTFAPMSQGAPGMPDYPPRGQAPPIQPLSETRGETYTPAAPDEPPGGEAVFRPPELLPER